MIVVVGFIVAAALVAVLLGNMVAEHRSAVALQRFLDAERALTADLHSRLAARTHGEYAAFATPPPPFEEVEYQHDPTGLMSFEVDRGQED